MTEPVYSKLTGRKLPWASETEHSDGGSSGGGDGSDMEQRVSALEKGMDKILGKLDDISRSIDGGRLENERRFGAIEGRLTGIEATLKSKADKADLTPIETRMTSVKDAVDTRAATSDLNLVKGRIEGLPTTIQLIGFAVAVFVAAGISRYFLH